MERAGTPKIEIIGVAGHPDVAHFGVRQSVKQVTITDETSTNAGADGEVEQRFVPGTSAPLRLSQGGSIDVCLDRHGAVERSLEWANQIGVRPMRLWCSGDMAPVGGRPVELQWAEGADADRGEFDILGPEPVNRGADCFFRRCCRNAMRRGDISLFVGNA